MVNIPGPRSAPSFACPSPPAGDEVRGPETDVFPCVKATSPVYDVSRSRDRTGGGTRLLMRRQARLFVCLRRPTR